MVKKNIKRVPTDKMKELSGFEEVFDLFESTEIREGSIDPRSGDDTFQLYNFLENENIRLQKLDQFYSSKVKTLKKHPQSKNLLAEQKQKKEQLLKQLVPKILSHDSAFNEEMERLFNKAFKPVDQTTESDD
ncbi:MAG: hypothetical protein COW01_00020 [Bdellovibrionales bacterium CG12_big_fil_rev_8_21_14_0_65_38_15]|nr:MAG: hypothetical protein COW01_00020 [Bdellovibrionales bacterium CG12_big_fil_rev_8_21_14_0_65_38_15]